jgi:hypothetical protein
VCKWKLNVKVTQAYKKMVCLSVSYWLHWFTIYACPDRLWAHPAFCSMRVGSSAHGRDIELNTHPSSAETKNEWSHTFIHTYAFMGAYGHLYIYHDLSYLCRGVVEPGNSRCLGLPGCSESRHKVARLSALRTGRLDLPSWKIPLLRSEAESNPEP